MLLLSIGAIKFYIKIKNKNKNDYQAESISSYYQESVAYLLSRLCTVDATTMQVRRVVNGQVVPPFAEKQDALGARRHAVRTALVSHACATTTKGDSPLEEMSIKEGVGTGQNQMPLHVVGRSWPPFGRLMGSWYAISMRVKTLRMRKISQSRILLTHAFNTRCTHPTMQIDQNTAGAQIPSLKLMLTVSYMHRPTRSLVLDNIVVYINY